MKNENFEISVRLDWLRYSAATGYPLAKMIPQEISIDYLSEVEPLPNYHIAYKLEPFGRIDVSHRNEQGVLVTYSGKDLEGIQTGGISPEYLLKYTHSNKWLHCSRVDVAIDVIGMIAPPSDIFKAWKKNKVKTHCRKIQMIEALDNNRDAAGSTVYVGSRKSDRMLRIYDKAIESGGDEELWLRIEAELKGDAAKVAQAKANALGLPLFMSNTINDLLSVSGVAWWKRVLKSLPVAGGEIIGKRKSKQDTSEYWLHHIALPAIQKSIMSGDEYTRDEILKTLIALGNKSYLEHEEIEG